MYIVKLDASGSLQWSRTVGGTANEYTNSIIQTTDGGYAAVGASSSFGAGYRDFYVVKLNSIGTLQWSKTVGGTSWEEATSIIQTTGGGYAVAGVTQSFGAGSYDMYIVKLDASGNTCGNSTSPTSSSSTGGTTTSPTSTVTSPPPTVISPTPTTGTGGNVTTLCLVGIQPVSNEIPAWFEIEQNYPNPFNPTTKISYEVPVTSYVKLIVYDILGSEAKALVNEKQNAGNYKVEFDGSNFPSGVYFYKLIAREVGSSAGDYVQTKKMILIK
jgi:hypothetical protein